MSIIKRPYRSLVDFSKVYQFMIDNYSLDWKHGNPAPFFEYAQLSLWTDYVQSHRNAIWEEEDKIVAFCYYESKIGDAFFSISDGYEFLIPEMINHAESRLAKDNGQLELHINMSQTAIIDEVSKRGYKKSNEWNFGIYDFTKALLDYPLPQGFSFEKPEDIDVERLALAIWRGFNHKDELEHGAEGMYRSYAAPHKTDELDIIIKNQNDEYVCFAGMWFTPKNKLAYMEPLCTVPEYRRLGLASAALSELYRRTSKMGATHMTGGSNDFYFNIGFEPIVKKSVWKKQS